MSERASMVMLLVVSATENTAQAVESHLRNQGHPVRAAWITDLEELGDALRRQAGELLLLEAPLDAAPVADVVALRDQFCPGLPLLLLAEDVGAEATRAAIAAGAQDVATVQDPDLRGHLEALCARALAISRDRRELQTLRSRMQRFERRHQQLLQESQDAIARLQEGILTHCNPAFAALLGIDTPDDLLGTPLLDLVAAEDAAPVKDQMKRIVKAGAKPEPTDLQLACRLVRRDGTTAPITAELTPGLEDGERCLDLLIRASAPEIADSGLTELPGRVALRQALERLSPEADRPTLVAVTVDDAASLERRVGLLDTEDLAEGLDHWLRERLEAQDDSFRVATLEWVLVLRQHEPRSMQSWSEALCSAVQQQLFTARHHETHLSCSVAAYPLALEDAPEEIAEQVVREARNLVDKGGKRAVTLGPVAGASAKVRALEQQAQAVQAALQEGRFRLAFQSIASLEGDDQHFYDVLLRMETPDGREVHAGEFIQAARQFKLMGAIDCWVVERARKLQLKRRGGDKGPGLFVKLSEQSLREADRFLPWVETLLKGEALRPNELIFEMPEDAVQNHIRKMKELCTRLQALGAAVAIDQFGTTANAQQLVQHLPVQFLKFHPVFTQESKNKDRQTRLAQLVEVARQQQIKTIVSHVEDAQTMARLWQLGVNYVQGFSVQEPEVVLLSAEAFAR